jgi:hypothetical protein
MDLNLPDTHLLPATMLGYVSLLHPLSVSLLYLIFILLYLVVFMNQMDWSILIQVFIPSILCGILSI